MSTLVVRRTSTRPLLVVALALALVMYGFPFVYLILTSFKPYSEALAVPPHILPNEWTVANYVTVLAGPGVVPSFINSIQTALISTALTLVLAIPAAYGVARFNTRAGRFFILMALVTRMVPPVAIALPMASLFRNVGILDTPTALAISHTTIALPLSIWLMVSFFDAVPSELEEAARADGCSRFGAFARVVAPVVSGGIAVTAIFAYLTSWNEFLFALLLTSLRAQTTPIVIANYQTQFNLDWGPMTALATLYSIPVIVLTLALQRHIVSGLTLGAVKG